MTDCEQYTEKECIEMEPGDIYTYYINHFFFSDDRGKTLAERLKSSDRYEREIKFRTNADFISALVYPGDTERKVLPQVLDMLERATVLEMWHIVAHCWYKLGLYYSNCHVYEKSVEYLIRAIQTEIRHNLHGIAGLAYRELAKVYCELEIFDKAMHYVKKAIEVSEQNSVSRAFYFNIVFSCYELMVEISFFLNLPDEFEEYSLKLNSLKKGDFKNLKFAFFSDEAVFSIHHMLYMFLQLSKGERTTLDCFQAFKKAEEHIVDRSNLRKTALYVNYVDSCLKYGVEYKYFEDVLHRLETFLPFDSADMNFIVLKLIYDFYKHINDEKKINQLKDMYIDALYAMVEQHKEQQKNSVELMETLLIDAEAANELGTRNSELKWLYKEAMNTKKQLQEAYHRIESINKIGKQLTSALSLNEVIGHFHEVLKEHLQIDTFALFVVDEDRGQLFSSISYYNGVLQPEIRIDLDNPDSLSVKCYRTNKLVNLDMCDLRPQDSDDVEVMHSATYLPLSVGDKVIGVYTVQHHEYNIYADELEFLSALAPFVAIALNNAIRSQSLEKEIHSRIVTQNKLQAVNKSLERISKQDGLTHISSRRNFEQDLVELIETARMKGDTVSVFMIDVDYFKLYNDTYGHLEGDEVLKRVANIFKKYMDAAGGLSARFGGEEFIGACMGKTPEENRNLAEKIRCGIHDLKIEHKPVRDGCVTVSIGVSYAVADDTVTRTDMMRMADILLYEAKNTGRNKSIIGNLK